MNKKRIVITIIIFVLGLGLFLCFNNSNKKDNGKDVSKKEESSVKSPWYKPNGDASKIEIYRLKTDNSYVSIKENEDKGFIDSKYEYKNTYNCTTLSCNMYQFGINSYKVVVKDDGYVLYDFEKNKAKKLDLPNALYNDIKILSSNGKDYGLAVSDINGMYAFYSFEKKLFTTDFKYSNIYEVETDGLSKGWISAVINTEEMPKYYIVNYKDDSILYESGAYIGIIGNENKTYFYENYSDLSGVNAIIYNSHFKPLFGEETYDMFGISESGNIILKDKDNSTFSMYNDEGKMVKTSKEYKYILMIVKDYVVVVDGDGILKVVDYDGNIKARFDKLTSDYIFNSETSGLSFENDDVILNIYIEKEENVITRFYYVPSTKEKGKIDL